MKQLEYPTFDPRKFREAILYIAHKSKADERFGLTKLYKLLFTSDFFAYAEHGVPITGAVYQHFPMGPVPRKFHDAMKTLARHGDAELVEGLHFGYSQKRVEAKREPDLSVLSDRDREILDSIIQLFWNMNATQISELSHGAAGWILTDENEDIPYQSAFVSLNGAPREAIEFGQKIAAELNLGTSA